MYYLFDIKNVISLFGISLLLCSSHAVQIPKGPLEAFTYGLLVYLVVFIVAAMIEYDKNETADIRYIFVAPILGGLLSLLVFYLGASF